MRLEKRNDVWVMEDCSYSDRFTPKNAGFWYDDGTKLGMGRIWYTRYPETAIKLVQYAGEVVKTQLEEILNKKADMVQKSQASSSIIEIPCPEGLSYLPFQKAGIDYALHTKTGHVLFADEMGLGKTIQAIGVVNSKDKPKKVLVVCPASLKLNWKRELEKWLIYDLFVEVVSAKSQFPTFADVIVINYDILKKFETELNAISWDYLIVDECHYIKNYKTKRNQYIRGIKAEKRIYLTGTPIINRPGDLYTIICQLGFRMTFQGFLKRYCGGDWVNGATNLPELQQRLREELMIRRLKKDVLTELPPKFRQVIEIPATFPEAIAALKKEKQLMNSQSDTLSQLQAKVELAKISENDADYYKAVRNLSEYGKIQFTEISAVRHETALAKLPTCIEHIIDTLENQDKIVVFAHHRDVIESLQEQLLEKGIKTVKLYGGMKEEDKQNSIDSFQNDTSVKVFIGSIMASGVGITLTAASIAIFIELAWTSAALYQAEDRLHRIGQLMNVLIQHLVLENSIDSKMAKTAVRKQEISDSALNSEHLKDKSQDDLDEPLTPDTDDTPAIRVSRVEVEKLYKEITPDNIPFIQEAIQTIASYCDGAQQRDGAGFNKVDSHIGKTLASYPTLSAKQAVLARKLVIKYRKQLSEELYKKIC